MHQPLSDDQKTVYELHTLHSQGHKTLLGPSQTFSDDDIEGVQDILVYDEDTDPEELTGLRNTAVYGTPPGNYLLGGSRNTSIYSDGLTARHLGAQTTGYFEAYGIEEALFVGNNAENVIVGNSKNIEYLGTGAERVEAKNNASIQDIGGSANEVIATANTDVDGIGRDSNAVTARRNEEVDTIGENAETVEAYQNSHVFCIGKNAETVTAIRNHRADHIGLDTTTVIAYQNTRGNHIGAGRTVETVLTSHNENVTRSIGSDADTVVAYNNECTQRYKPHIGVRPYAESADIVEAHDNDAELVGDGQTRQPLKGPRTNLPSDYLDMVQGDDLRTEVTRREITDTIYEAYRELEEAGKQAIEKANALENHIASTYSDQTSEQRRAYAVLDEHDIEEDILPASRAHRRIDQILAEYENQALRDLQSSYRAVTQRMEARQRRREKRVQERREQQKLQRIFRDGWDDRKAVEYLYDDLTPERDRGHGDYPIRNHEATSSWYDIPASPTHRQGFREQMRKGIPLGR